MVESGYSSKNVYLRGGDTKGKEDEDLITLGILVYSEQQWYGAGVNIGRAQETYCLFHKYTTLDNTHGVYRSLDRVEFAEADAYELLKFIKCKDNKF